MGYIKWDKEDKKPEELRGYMYGIEYGYHLGNDVTGTRVYPTVADVYEAGPGSYPNEESPPQDGLVEVEVKFIRHIPAEKCWEKYQKQLKAEEADRKEITNKIKN